MCKCGKSENHWSHQVNHPVVSLRPEAHEFQPLSAPEVTHREEDYPEFNNVMDDDVIAWAIGD